MQASSHLVGPKRANIDIVAIISLQIVPGISSEDAGLRICASPVRANIEYLAGEKRAREVAADDWYRAADSYGAFAEPIIGCTVHICGVQVGQAWGSGI